MVSVRSCPKRTNPCSTPNGKAASSPYVHSSDALGATSISAVLTSSRSGPTATCAFPITSAGSTRRCAIARNAVSYARASARRSRLPVTRRNFQVRCRPTRRHFRASSPLRRGREQDMQGRSIPCRPSRSGRRFVHGISIRSRTRACHVMRGARLASLRRIMAASCFPIRMRSVRASRRSGFIRFVSRRKSFGVTAHIRVTPSRLICGSLILNAPDQDKGFDEPWQAHAWVIGRDLCARGVFSPGEWSAALGAKLRARGGDGNLAYYEAVLDALESLLAEKGAASSSELAQL